MECRRWLFQGCFLEDSGMRRACPQCCRWFHDAVRSLYSCHGLSQHDWTDAEKEQSLKKHDSHTTNHSVPGVSLTDTCGWTFEVFLFLTTTTIKTISNPNRTATPAMTAIQEMRSGGERKSLCSFSWPRNIKTHFRKRNNNKTAIYTSMECLFKL